MGSTTSRLALPYPVPTDPNNVPQDLQALAEKLDGLVASWSEGTLAAQPAAAVKGRVYSATDTGGIYYDTGATWIQLNLNSATLAQAKGDLLVGTGPAAVSRFPIGLNGQVLQAQSGATLGVQWANLLGLPLGLPGAAASTRYVGGTTSGAPTTGTFAKGDFVVAQNGAMWICTAGGAPGTWAQPYGGAGTPSSSTTPLCSLEMLTTLTLPTSSWVYATDGWSTLTDTDGMAHPAASDPTRSYIQINTAGRYLVHLHANISGVPDGKYATARIMLNTANADSNSIGSDSTQGTGAENDLDVWREKGFSVGDRIYWSFWSNASSNAGRVQPDLYGDVLTKVEARYVGPL